MSKCRWALLLLGQLALVACGGPGRTSSRAAPSAVHSSSLALSADGRVLFVVNPDADSVSVLDVQSRMLKREIPLGDGPPAPDSASGNYTPAILPRSVALAPAGGTLYVTGERANALLVVDIASGRVQSRVPVGSEPVGVVVSPAGDSVYVACSQDATVVRVDAKSLQVTATAQVADEPWALALSADGSQLFATHLLGPGVTEIDPSAMIAMAPWVIPDTAPRGDKRLAHGQVRGVYDALLRPGTNELWVAHTLLGTDTAQPELDFESSAFPALSLLHLDGTYEQTLTTDAQDVPGVDGSLADVVSGPHALAFTPDGAYVLMVAANSEDVMVVDASRRVESDIVRPLPGEMPEGIVMSSDGSRAFVDERNSGDVAVLRLDRSTSGLQATVDGPPIARLSHDPMPETLRLGQALFNSANSTRYPITTDHWMACATCHMEGRSDAVTWSFAQGPRDTPSNAGGMLGTGFLFRTADRNQVQDYWHTINVEQGGRFDPTAQAALLDALTAYVNQAIPLPLAPTTDAALVEQGARVFQASDCGSCHSGDRFTDSGAENPTLDLAGPVRLHDVGTCVTSGFPDVEHEDVAGHAREACAFDTPSLSGVASSAPYLHDGSAATLRDAVQKMPGAPASAAELDALVEYLRSL
jgi:YVTN family beta-propeller protein